METQRITKTIQRMNAHSIPLPLRKIWFGKAIVVGISLLSFIDLLLFVYLLEVH